MCPAIGCRCDAHFFFCSFEWNGFIVIMNSNHAFGIKARPVEELKFISTTGKPIIRSIHLTTKQKKNMLYTNAQLPKNFVCNFYYTNRQSFHRWLIASCTLLNIDEYEMKKNATSINVAQICELVWIHLLSICIGVSLLFYYHPMCHHYIHFEIKTKIATHFYFDKQKSDAQC